MICSGCKSILRYRQCEDKPLSAFVCRFNKVTLNTPKKSDNMVIVAFTYGLRLRPLFKKLVGEQPMSMKDMMERVHRYMKQEDATYEKGKIDEGEKIIVHKDNHAP